MKRRICILLAAFMLAFALTSCTDVNASITRNVSSVDATSMKEALANTEDFLHWKELTFSQLQKRVVSGQPPDLIRTQVILGHFDTLRGAGMITPFTPDETLVNDLETMPPFTRELIRKYLVTEDGKFWGCPQDFSLTTMLFYVPDAWADSPFRDRTPPTSFEEFLDFAELYLDTPHEGFCLLGLRTDEKYYTEWQILNLLLETWTIQKQYAGEPFQFISEEFVSLLDRTKKLLIRLQKEEPLTYKKQKGLRELFTNPDGRYDGGKTEVSRELYNWDHMIPYRIYADQPPLVNVFGGSLICVCNPDADPMEVNRYMENLIRQRDWPEKHEVPYSAYTHPERMDADECNKEYFPEVKDGYMTQQWLDSIGRIQGVPCWLSEYFFDYASEEGKTGIESYEFAMKFIKNKKMSAEKYAQELERMSR